MRKTQSTFLTTAALIAAALCALLHSAHAQSGITTIFNVTDKSWRYYQAGNQPPNNTGVDWKHTNYNDTAWSSGFGVFAFEPDNPENYPINTTLNRSNVPPTAAVITYYFRTHFNLPTNPANVILYCSNLVDDGVAAYLNGQPLYSIRVPANPVYGTFASGGPAAEGTRELATVAGHAALRQGDNILAVELHDTSGSSDVAFGMALAYGFGERAVITKQPPPSIVAPDQDEVTIAVTATGDNLRYAWFRNNVFLANQTNSSLALNNVTTANNGTYHAVVSNVFNSVRSSNCVLTVVPDTFGPCVLGAYIPVADTNRVIIDLNEDPLRFHANTNFSALNPSNYVITEIGNTSQIEVTNVGVLVGGKQIRLTVETNFNKLRSYQLCIYNIADIRTNRIALNSCVPIGIELSTNGVPDRANWVYYVWGWLQPLDSVNWKAYNYVEDPEWWSVGQAMFLNDQTGGGVNVPCTAQNTIPSLASTTYYYRHKFTLATNVLETNITASITHVTDDGLVLYLNGVEILRFNMPSGTPLYDTLASSAIANATCVTRDVEVGHLLTRSNILSAEVHQAILGDEDTAFDCDFTLNYTRFPRLTNDAAPNTVRLRHARTNINQMRMFWTNGLGYALESTTNLNTPWLEVQPPSTNLTINATNRAGFYRLKKRH